jgi:hypothetical protein
MEIEINNVNGMLITEIISEEIIIRKTQDALNILAESGYRGSDNIILHEKNILSDFFELRSGLAGDILQKFSNYKVRLAIVGDFTKY